MNTPETNSICCPPFNPQPWENQTLQWQDKLFIKKETPSFFHMPLPGSFNRMISKTWKLIDDSHARPEQSQFLWICHDPSPWKSEHYFHVTKEIPGAEHVRLSGTFMTNVFEGPFSAIPNWIKEMEQFVKHEGQQIKKLYFYYTTCPKCAKKYGKNYIVLIAQV